MKKFSITLVLFLTLVLTTSGLTTDYYVDSSVTDTNVASATPDFTTYNPATFETTGPPGLAKRGGDARRPKWEDS